MLFQEEGEEEDIAEDATDPSNQDPPPPVSLEEALRSVTQIESFLAEHPQLVSTNSQMQFQCNIARVINGLKFSGLPIVAGQQAKISNYFSRRAPQAGPSAAAREEGSASSETDHDSDDQ
jgi:hypothetical protein